FAALTKKQIVHITDDSPNLSAVVFDDFVHSAKFACDAACANVNLILKQCGQKLTHLGLSSAKKLTLLKKIVSSPLPGKVESMNFHHNNVLTNDMIKH